MEDALYSAGMILETNYGHLEKIGWSRSSRTDKGVHSMSTIFGCRLEGMWTRLNRGTENYEYDIEGECVELPDMINKHLPPEIRVFAAAPVVQHFDARKSCIHRHYDYLIPSSALEGSAYFEDREAWERMLKMFVGRHHWHNFGQVDRKSKGGQRPRFERNNEVKMQEEGGIDSEEAEEVSLEQDGAKGNSNANSKRSNERESDDKGSNLSNNASSGSFGQRKSNEREPSLLDVAPSSLEENSNRGRPSLYALDEFKSSDPHLASPFNAKQETPRQRHVHKPHFTAAAAFRGNEKDSPLSALNSSEEEPRTISTQDLSSLSAKEVASMPLDEHLTQDSFFRTISAVSHDEVYINGELYVRISMQGDSFLLHQVRRMVGGLVLAAKGIFTEEVLKAAIDAPFRILTPRAPSRGLLLRNARFLDVDFHGRDIKNANEFATSYLYPHMHERWNSKALLEGEEEELLQLNFDMPVLAPDGTRRTKGIWDELISTKPIENVRDIIPGYDEWLEWHEKDAIVREQKRQHWRTRFEETSGRTRSRPARRLTTKLSY